MEKLNLHNSNIDEIGYSIIWCYRNGYEVNEMLKDLLDQFKEKIYIFVKDNQYVHIDTYYKKCTKILKKDIIEYSHLESRAEMRNKFEGIVILLIVKQILDDFYQETNMKDMIDYIEIRSIIENDFTAKWHKLYNNNPIRYCEPEHQTIEQTGEDIKDEKQPIINITHYDKRKTLFTTVLMESKKELAVDNIKAEEKPENEDSEKVSDIVDQTSEAVETDEAELLKISKTRRTQIEPLENLFPGKEWKDLEIQFVSDDSIRLICAGFDTIVHNYDQLSFTDKRRNNMPNTIWETLNNLAEHKGELSVKDIGFEKRKQTEKRISILRSVLRRVTGINGNPISFDIKAKPKMYKTEFRISDHRGEY